MKSSPLGLLVLALAASPGIAQDPAPGQPPAAAASTAADHAASFAVDGHGRSPWCLRVIPYGWIAGVEGDLTVRGVTAPVDVSIGRTLDILFNDLNFAAVGQVEASNGTFGVLINGQYLDVSPDKEIRNLDFSSRTRTAILDCTLTWNLEGVPCRLGLPEGSKFEALAGVRYNSVSAGLTVTGPAGNSATAAGTEDWLDPIFGGRFRVPLRECLTGQLRGDIGGFDIGEASEFTWNIEAILEYRCSERCSLFAGYRWLDIDYRAGSGRQRFGFDMILSGPLMGLALDF